MAESNPASLDIQYALDQANQSQPSPVATGPLIPAPQSTGPAGGITPGYAPTMSAPSRGNFTEPEMPLKGSDSQPSSDDEFEVVGKGAPADHSDDDFEVVGKSPAPQSYWDSVNQHAGEVFKGVGKQALQLLVGDPSVASINPAARVQQLADDKELGQDLQSQNGAQTAGKFIVGGGLIAANGESLVQGVKSLTQFAKGRMGTLLDSNVSTALHSDLGQTLSKVAQEAGVEVKPTSDVRKLVGNVADAVREKAQSKLDEVDQLFKGLSDDDSPMGLEHYSDIQNTIAKKQKDLAMLKSSSPAPQGSITSQTSDQTSAAEKVAQKSAQIKSEINALQKQKSGADDALDAQGLKGARETADKLFEQADALDKLKKAHAKSTFGPPGQGLTNPVKFNEQLGELHDNGVLHAAVGEDHAQDVMNSAGSASRLLARNAKLRTVAKYAAGAAAGHELLKGAARYIPEIP